MNRDSGSELTIYTAACELIKNLNPVRAEIVRPEQELQFFRWSSYPAYLRPQLRPSWLRVDRLLGEQGLIADTAKSRRELDRIMKPLRLEPGDQTDLRRNWKIGGEDFRDWLAGKLSRRGRKGERASERSETDIAMAQRLVLEAIARLRWREIDLAIHPKGHPSKVRIARRLRQETPMTYQWNADRLLMGSGSYVFNLVTQLK